MRSDILALLRLFQDRVPDRETHARVSELAADETRWPEAHEMFCWVRDRTLEAEEKRDGVRTSQYLFDEICLKCLYNETATDMPFDRDSPHWITKCAIELAREVGIPNSEVIAILVPHEVRGLP